MGTPRERLTGHDDTAPTRPRWSGEGGVVAEPWRMPRDSLARHIWMLLWWGHKHRPLYHFGGKGRFSLAWGHFVEYRKPHLTFEQQLDLLKSRGMHVDDEARALQMLRSIGYYRLSAYVYPFRQLLPDDQQVGRHYRCDEILPDVTWTDVEELWNFDRTLRLRCLDALEIIEVGARTQIAYVLGARDPFGHVNQQSLDSRRCACLIPGGTITAFDQWLAIYDRQCDDARNEDYVQHHHLTYAESDIPIWVACEFLSFGSLVRLFGLMQDRDQTAVARSLGVSSGTKMWSFLHSMSYVRNVCAHHSRLWNRQLTVKLPKFHPSEVGSDLHHLAGLAVESKIYPTLAIMAYLVRNIAPHSRWPIRLAEHVKKFPSVPYLSPGVDMAFPSQWDRLPLWHDLPRGTGHSFPTSKK